MKKTPTVCVFVLVILAYQAVAATWNASTTSGFYQLESNLLDRSGNGNNLTLQNAFYYDTTTPKIGTGSGNSSGTNQWAKIVTAANAPTGNSDFTVIGWWRRNAALNAYPASIYQNRLWSMGTIGTTARASTLVTYDNNGYCSGKTAFFLESRDNGYGCGAATILTLGTWYHLGWTYHGSNHSMDMFVNGVYNFTITFTNNQTLGSTFELFEWTTQENTANWHWNGSVDDLRVYNFALTNQELLNAYNAGAGTNCTNLDTLSGDGCIVPPGLPNVTYINLTSGVASPTQCTGSSTVFCAVNVTDRTPTFALTLDSSATYCNWSNTDQNASLMTGGACTGSGTSWSCTPASDPTKPFWNATYYFGCGSATNSTSSPIPQNQIALLGFRTVPNFNNGSETPGSGSTYSPGTTYTFTRNITDDAGNTLASTPYVLWNGVQYEGISNGTDTYRINFSQLAAGDYGYNWTALSHTHYQNTSPHITYVVAKATSVITMGLSENDTLYGTGVRITCNKTTGEPAGLMSLLINGTPHVFGGTGNIDHTQTENVGSYSYNCTYVASENYTSTSQVQNAVVRKAASSMTLTLNLNENNVFGEIPYVVAISANMTPATETFNITDNTALILVGTGVLTNTTTYLKTGNHTITATYMETANYNGSLASWTADAQDTTTPTVNLNNPPDDLYTTDTTFNFTWTTTDNTANTSCTLLTGGANWCYQDAATDNTACAQTSPGTYERSDTYNYKNEQYINDSDWTTDAKYNASASGGESRFIINYTLPTNAILSQSLWQVEAATHTPVNYSLPTTCQSKARSINMLRLRMKTVGGASAGTTLQCCSGTTCIFGGGGGWTTITTKYGTSNVTEEGVWWALNNTLETVQALNNTPTNYSVSGFSSGVSYWNVSCFDGTNTGDSATYTFTIDNNPPRFDNATTTNDVSSLYTPTLNVTLTIDISDALGTVDTAFLTWNSTTYNPTTAGNTRTVTLPVLPAGTYYYNWTANDTLANTDTTGTLEYTINQTNPTITLTASPNPNLVAQNTAVNCSVTNPQGTTLTFYMNGTLNATGTSPLETTLGTLSLGNHFLQCNNTQTQNYTAGQANTTLIINPNLYIFAQNTYDNTTITNFNITWNGTTYQSSSGTVTLPLAINSGTINLSILNGSYFPANYTNQDTTTNITLTANETLITIRLINNYTSTPITGTTFTLTNGTNTITTNTGTHTFSPHPTKTYYFTITAPGFTTKYANITTPNPLDQYNIDINYSLGTDANYQLDNCSTLTTQALSIITKTSTDFSLLTTNMEGWFEYWTDDPTTKKSVNLTWKNNNTHTICTNTTLTTLYTNGQIQYYATGYPTNTYYFIQAPLTNTTTTLTLLLDPNATTTEIFKVIDYVTLPVSEAYITLLGYDFGTNTYTTDQMIKTGTDGTTTGTIELLTRWYKASIQHQNRTYLVTEPFKFTTTTKTFQIETTNATTISVMDPHGTSCALNYTNASRTFGFFWSNPTGLPDTGCLYVYTETGPTQTLYNSSCAAGTAQTFITLPPDTGTGTWIATAQVTYDGQTYDCGSPISHTDNNDYLVYGNTGIIATILIFLALIGAGAWNPVVAVFLGIAAILVSAWLHLINIGLTSVVAIAVLVGIYLYRLQQK